MVKQFLALLDVCEILRVIVRTIFWATFAIGVANFSALCWTLAFHFAFALGSESSAFQGAITVLVPPETNVHTEDLFSWAGVVARNGSFRSSCGAVKQSWSGPPMSFSSSPKEHWKMFFGKDLALSQGHSQLPPLLKWQSRSLAALTLYPRWLKYEHQPPLRSLHSS